MTRPISYALITPARDESENLARLGCSLVAQTVRPEAWIIVDNGSTDDTAWVAEELAGAHDWIRLVRAPSSDTAERGGPIVKAFQAGLEALEGEPDVVVKLDADLSMEQDYFARLLGEFERDPSLGIASGSGFEFCNGEWRQKFLTQGSVWGACRAYRWSCLREVLPLEASMGWDGLDALKANMRGWRTETLLDLPFRHHRPEGARDGTRFAAYAAQGRGAHYMGYRFWYLVLRALHRASIEIGATGLIWGYISASVQRRPRCPDEALRAYLRRQQRLRNVPRRRREALGRS